MDEYQSKILKIHEAFLLEFRRTSCQLEELYKAVNSCVDCAKMKKNERDVQAAITDLQYTCFLLKSFCAEANLNVKSLTPEDRNETIEKMTQSEIIEDTKLLMQTDDLNKTLAYECYSEVFTCSMIDPSQYKIGFEAEFGVAYMKDSVQHLFFIMETTCRDIVIKHADIQYYHIPDGGIIFGLLLDGCMVRAVREKQLKIPEIPFKALLIDFGEIIEICKESKMYRLPENQQKIPGQAIFCKLMMDDNNCDDQRFLENNLHTKQTFRIERILGNMLEVTVNPTGSSKISESCESSNFTAEKISGSPHHTKEEYILLSPFSDVKSIKNGLTQEQIDDFDTSEAVMGYKPGDDMGAICKLKHTTIVKDEWTNDDEPYKVKIHSKIPTPRVGKKINLLISHVADVDKFYGQIIPKHCRSTKDLTVERITNEINSNTTKSKLQPFKLAPAEFQLVFAMYEDELWYRAKIVQKFSDGHYKVFYVDYGNCSTVTLEELRRWDDAFDCYPFQALECELDNVIKLQDKEAITCFEKLVLHQPVKATVTYNARRLRVTLKNVSGCDIGEQLCGLRYAQQKPTTELAG